jgi:glycosyltransferase involved in cell wall biosynthesis
MRLDNEKDPLTWINTFAEITKVDPNLEARIIGEGPLRRLVLERIGELGLESRIILEGKTTSPLEVIQRAVLLLLTSSEEGMPNVVLEAQACGKVIVATDVGGVREALAPPLHQFLCRPKDPQALAKACLRVLTEPDEAHRLGQQAKAYVEIQFGLTRLVDRTLQVLASVPTPIKWRL